MDHHPRRSAAVAPSMPDDALVEILSCVPAKSLCRFNCVSKAWRDLISDRLRCNKLPQTLAGCFVDVEEKDTHDGNSDEGRDVKPDRIIYGRFINTFGRFVPLASFSFLGKQPGIEKIHLLHSCNGLLLFGHRKASETYDSLGYIVCNPATEQWVAVPRSIWKPHSDNESDEDAVDPDYEDRHPFTYLIFDPAASSHFQLIQSVTQYEVFQVCVKEVHAYSSETGVWRETTDEWSSAEELGVSSLAGSALVNGMLHFSSGEQIIAVDGEGKECKVIRGPEKRADVVFVGQSQGYLHYITQHRDNTRKMTGTVNLGSSGLRKRRMGSEA